MREDYQSVDVVARAAEVVLSVSSVELQPTSVALLGTLLDPEVRSATGALSPVGVSLQLSLDDALAGGEHVARETVWTLEADGWRQQVEWAVTAVDLSDGFAMQDARARVGELNIRAFAIEDLAATVGVCLAGCVGGLAVWLHHKRSERAQDDALSKAEREFARCLEAGGSPTIRVGVSGEATTSFTPELRLQIKQGVTYELNCQMPR